MIVPAGGGGVNAKRVSSTLSYPRGESTTPVALGVPAKVVMVNYGSGFSAETAWVMPGDVADRGWGLSADGQTLLFNTNTSSTTGGSVDYTYVAWY